MYLSELVSSFSLDKYPEVEFLDHMVVLFLVFLRGTCKLLYIVAAAIYIPINSAQEFPFLYILVNT